MKNILISLLLFLFAAGIAGGQPVSTKSRKELRKERANKISENTKNLINSRSFVFEANQAHPMGGGSIQLTSPYDLVIRGDSAIAYLPYFGVAYHAEYGLSEGGIKFTEPLFNYKSAQKRSVYEITFEVDAPKDDYKLHLSVSEAGYATLNVTCVNRQFISFSGRIEPVENQSGK